jgi:BlaI family transcriptional regulator, penicillinase repressor
MPRTAKEVTDAELAVLRQLWETGTCTIRALTERLYPACSASCYATVQKLLERLEGKGCVARERSPSVHTFRAAVCRNEMIHRGLRSVADKLCDGSLTPLLAELVRAGRLSAKEREDLRKLIGAPDNNGRGRRRPERPVSNPRAADEAPSPARGQSPARGGGAPARAPAPEGRSE